MSSADLRPMTLSDIAASLDLTGARFAAFAKVRAQKPLDPAELDELANWAFRMAQAVRFQAGAIAGALEPPPENVIPLRNRRPAIPSPVDAADDVAGEGGAEGGAA